MSNPSPQASTSAGSFDESYSFSSTAGATGQQRKKVMRPSHTTIVSKAKVSHIIKLVEAKLESFKLVLNDTSYGKIYNKMVHANTRTFIRSLEKKLKNLRTLIRSRDQLDQMVERLIQEDNLAGARAITYAYNQIAYGKV